MSAFVSVVLGSEKVSLLPQKALYWKRGKTLLVADVNFGKVVTFRAAAMPVASGSTHHMLARLSAALHTTRAEQLIVLGDLLHRSAGRGAALMGTLDAWRSRWRQLAVLVVRGSHDARSSELPAAWRFRVVSERHIDGCFVFRHLPQADANGYTLAGHVHPAVRLARPGESQRTAPCFVFGAEAGIVPAFGDFGGMRRIAPTTGDRVFAIAGQQVVPVPAVTTPV